MREIRDLNSNNPLEKEVRTRFKVTWRMLYGEDLREKREERFPNRSHQLFYKITNHLAESISTWEVYLYTLKTLPNTKQAGIQVKVITKDSASKTVEKKSVLNFTKKNWLKFHETSQMTPSHLLTMRSSPPKPISPINAMSFGMGNSKELKETKESFNVNSKREKKTFTNFVQ